MATAKKIEKNGKSLRFATAVNGLNLESAYNIEEALEIVKKAATTKFDESIDLAVNLGIDVKQSDQNVRGVVSLPNGTGKKVTVAVFANEEKQKEAKKAGAKIVGGEELIEQVAKGEINFDKCIATPEMMPKLGKVAKVLGPKGLMPNPKLGTVTEDVAGAVEKALAGQVEYRADKGGVVHAIIGKASFDDAKLAENAKALVAALVKAKPSGAKGIYLKRISLSSTMGPGVKITIASVTEQKN